LPVHRQVDAADFKDRDAVDEAEVPSHCLQSGVHEGLAHDLLLVRQRVRHPHIVLSRGRRSPGSELADALHAGKRVGDDLREAGANQNIASALLKLEQEVPRLARHLCGNQRGGQPVVSHHARHLFHQIRYAPYVEPAAGHADAHRRTGAIQYLAAKTQPPEHPGHLIGVQGDTEQAADLGSSQFEHWRLQRPGIQVREATRHGAAAERSHQF